MGRKRRANKKSAAIVTRRTALRMNADPGPFPPKTNKPKTNNSHGGASSSKKRAAAIVTQSSTDQRGKTKLTPNSDPLAVSEKPKSMKRGNVESSSRPEKGKAKLEASEKKMEKGKAKEDETRPSKKAKLTISEERANVQPASGVLTRGAKARMDSQFNH